MSQHPTILIGYGAYGLRVLHSFLASAAARGALEWEEIGSVGSLNERRLRSLSAIWVREVPGAGESAETSSALGETSYELMDDVYAQVETVAESAVEIREKLADVVEREKKRLLDTGLRGEAAFSGLDVFIIAQPSTVAAIGFLRSSLAPAMNRLAADPAFGTVQEGSNTLLNFIEMLDFEDYWTPRMETVRTALRNMLDAQNQAFAEGSATVGRVYLFDGIGGRRPADARLQEVVLFIELLLLEGLRATPDARNFYAPENAGRPPVCTVGVRVIERSSGLLRRLAAGAFAQSWLSYIGSAARGDLGASPFAELLEPFRGEHLAQTAGERQLLELAAREKNRVEQALLQISPDLPDWGTHLRKAADRETETAILHLSQASGAHSNRLSHGVLANFRQELERTITLAMQERSPALTLGTVIDELKQMEDAFGDTASENDRRLDPSAPSDAVFEEAERMQREYVTYRSRQVQTARLAIRWWPRAAILFALALLPILVRAINETGNNSIPAWVLDPISAVVLGGAFWLFGRQTIQPVLERSTERAREFYTDPDRGRLAERVRQIAASESVAGRIDGYANLIIFGLRQFILGAVAAELQHARSLLLKRRDEVEWLQRQVGEFLVSYQVDSSGTLPRFEEGRVPSDVRFSLERTEDLETIAQSVPRGPDRFREFVAANQLFAGWSRPYCDTFLHPLPFLDQLSQKFQDRLELDPAESRRRASEISAILRQAHVPVCFFWATEPQSARRGSMFPASWRLLEGVPVELMTAGFAEHAIESRNNERLYLFNAMLGVDTENLVIRQ